MKLSIVIPVYNEETTLEEIVERVQQAPYEKELILVDDCSKDSTPEIMAKLEQQYDNVRCFRHEVNKGKGGALATGFSKVSGDVVLIQDADLEYDPADYPVLLRPIEEAGADVVYGSRFLGGPYVRVHLFYHYLGNRFLTLMSNCFTNLNLTDMETCYKVFRREVADKIDIQSSTFAVEPEITAKVARLRCRIYEVPISYAGRDYSEGKKIGPKDAVIALWAIVRWSPLFFRG
ncbi:glycosyltransferase family 2 protein [Engelhardtia mirabilis]|uniref:Undecaprenyl-phosphate mannosyltransferase n=1 Tax=Engelhardtia mirabilis TaxID=2528011 RepID=A0A518BJD5_9BACT|nr:Undecaprenyl-phosphate mannosyltransferase [Planctomycetes bacterium Pla133]QDV01405.1 Undecaprenyl-phosphate mannosyltransferase [Planctomycetes bacterium Pla86]